MKPSWAQEAVFYHIYPLGLCGAPERNDFSTPPTPRLELLVNWLDHIQELGANAVYLGPLFESSAHGYDTADYFQVDRRLGSLQTLKELAQEIHNRGLRLVFDGVFNHVGRDFWAFTDLLAHQQQSPYRDWFYNLDFGRSSPYQDPFSYEGWSGHYDLVKLNLANPEVCAHLFKAVQFWVEEFEIDGLRLDTADHLAPEFLESLSTFCRGLRDDFWLMGEVVHGDYRRIANMQMLDSVTNYESYKGLYSSLVDRNYFEIAYTLNRQFGPNGIYRDLSLYSFADNHDVDRVSSRLADAAHLYPLYCLLFTMPGIPSIYYGSEWGITGQRTASSDQALRPQLDLQQAGLFPQPALAAAITRLAKIHQASTALRQGNYQELVVKPEQFAFLRSHTAERVVVLLNAAAAPAALDLRLPVAEGRLVDLLNEGDHFPVSNFQAHIEQIPPTWGRICLIQKA